MTLMLNTTLCNINVVFEEHTLCSYRDKLRTKYSDALWAYVLGASDNTPFKNESDYN